MRHLLVHLRKVLLANRVGYRQLARIVRNDLVVEELLALLRKLEQRIADDRRSAGAVLLVKTVLGAVFAGSMLRFLYSLAGGVCCFAVAAALKSAITEKQLWFLSARAACAHNFGQLLTARVVLGTSQVWWYAPILALAGVVTGVFTGFCARFALPVLRNASFK